MYIQYVYCLDVHAKSVAVCCSVLQCVAVCCSVLQNVHQDNMYIVLMCMRRVAKSISTDTLRYSSHAHRMYIKTIYILKSISATLRYSSYAHQDNTNEKNMSYIQTMRKTLRRCSQVRENTVFATSFCTYKQKHELHTNNEKDVATVFAGS